MTSGTAPSSDFEQRALGYARRSAGLLAALLGGLCIGASGAAGAVTAFALGLSPSAGLIMVAVGVAACGIGWLATLGVRFTSKPPAPADNAAATESSSGSNVAAMWVLSIVVWAGALALAIFSPNGRQPESLVFLPAVMAIPATLLGAMIRIRQYVLQRESRYAAWLSRR